MQTAAAAVNTLLSDAELARRVAERDKEALRQLMRCHNRILYRTARSILKDDAQAEDVLQEAYLRAFHAIGAFRGESKLCTWLIRIVANEALARLRKCTGAVRASPEQPERAAQLAQTRRLLEAEIDLLPDAFRAVFVLRALEELSVEETAAALDIPEATVRTRFFRAKGLLREALSREVDFAVEDAFAFDGARCDRIVAAVMARIEAGAAGSGAQ